VVWWIKPQGGSVAEEELCLLAQIITTGCHELESHCLDNGYEQDKSRRQEAQVDVVLTGLGLSSQEISDLLRGLCPRPRCSDAQGPRM
jgi:hypothetical protein